MTETREGNRVVRSVAGRPPVHEQAN